MPKGRSIPQLKSRGISRTGQLAERLRRYLQSRYALHPGERIGVAVSGGADSVALLFLLLEIRADLGLILSVIHFNHQLRGKASAADENFVAKLAFRHSLEFLSEHEDIAARAKRERANLEDVARRARYSFFERLAIQGRVNRVAVAHTADDQAETVLAHILRGTGLSGLGGIHPEAGPVFRPLLKTRRAELRAYLSAKEQPWREDATNRDTERTRARVRHRLMPLLEREFQPAVVDHLCRLAELARQDEVFLTSQAAELERQMARRTADEIRIPVKMFSAGKSGQLNRALYTRVIRRVVRDIKFKTGQLCAEHVEAVLQMAECPDSGKTLNLPGGVQVQREQDALRFGPAATKSRREETRLRIRSYSYPVKLGTRPTDLPVLELSTFLRFRVIDWPPEGRDTRTIGAVLDRDRLLSPLLVRNWRPGDAMRPCGHRKSHKLARLLNEIGVSRWEKCTWPVVTSGASIVWSRGLPVAAEFGVNSGTRSAVTISEERET